jgi:hypothetical protein
VNQPAKRDPVQSTIMPPPYVQPMVIRCRVKEVAEGSRNGKPSKVSARLLFIIQL